MASPSPVATTRRRRFQRFRGDDGAALIEAAIVSPILLVFLFGLFDEGMLFRDYLTMENASTVGAREVSIDPKNPTTDWRALGAVRKSAGALSGAGIAKVVVYKATGGTDTISNHPGCINASASPKNPDLTPAFGSCNLYTAVDIASTTNPLNAPNYDCVNKPLTSPSRFWCPADRIATNAAADYAGVYMQYQHNYITKFFGNSRIITSETIIRLEPQSN